MDWRPVADLMREIHEGDPSIRNGWPVEYWRFGSPLTILDQIGSFRYASVFRIWSGLIGLTPDDVKPDVGGRGTMQFRETPIAGVWVIDPDAREDERGRFFRAWCSKEFAEHGIEFLPVQANMGYSAQRGTVRGMHFQIEPAPEAKLIRCTRGSMFDVALDMRSGSPTRGQWFGTDLTAANGRMLYLPAGCAHGYQTLEDGTEMHYMTSQVYTPNACRGARFDDPVFGIRWPLPVAAMSEQDRNWPLSDPAYQS